MFARFQLRPYDFLDSARRKVIVQEVTARRTDRHYYESLAERMIIVGQKSCLLFCALPTVTEICQKGKRSKPPVSTGEQMRQNSLSEAFLTLWLLPVSFRGKVSASETWDFAQLINTFIVNRFSVHMFNLTW
jgi:hypothetical protein